MDPIALHEKAERYEISRDEVHEAEVPLALPKELPEAGEGPIALSIVIPIYNEEEILREAVDELRAGMGEFGLDYEVLLAENGSNQWLFNVSPSTSLMLF